jgi:hypothetical protein
MGRADRIADGQTGSHDREVPRRIHGAMPGDRLLSQVSLQQRDAPEHQRDRVAEQHVRPGDEFENGRHGTFFWDFLLENRFFDASPRRKVPRFS